MVTRGCLFQTSLPVDPLGSLSLSIAKKSNEKPTKVFSLKLPEKIKTIDLFQSVCGQGQQLTEWY
jgi:hypothetical protein